MATNVLNMMMGRLVNSEKEMARLKKQIANGNTVFRNYTWAGYDGSGNNLDNPTWGMLGTALLRRSPVDYADGVSSLAVRSPNNPNPRIVSNAICAQSVDIPNTMGLTDMTWAWGQFIDHDIGLTPANSSEPANMTTPSLAEDPSEQFPNRTILFNRSVGIIGTNPRQQPNEISAYLDGTNVYGSNAERAMALRRLDGTGKLSVGLADNGEEILIYNTAGLHNDDPTGLPPSQLFLAGDVRANENVVLISMHTLLMREHNRICDDLIAGGFNGTEEDIFQKARSICNGIVQNITYREFLPALLGTNGLSEYTGYDPTVNASIATEFSTVGFRLGHTMLSSQLKVGTSGSILLRDGFFTPSYIQSNGIDALLYGASTQVMQEIDGKVVDDVRNFLFGPPTAMNLLDLASLNIQRARDHGISGYNSVRTGYGLNVNNSFSAITDDMMVQSSLATLYNTPDAIDPWIGVLVERHLTGSAVGQLAQTIIKDQFERLRAGDRYYFENNVFLTDEEKEEIKTTTLSDVINRNISGFAVPSDVFHI